MSTFLYVFSLLLLLFLNYGYNMVLKCNATPAAEDKVNELIHKETHSYTSKLIKPFYSFLFDLTDNFRDFLEVTTTFLTYSTPPSYFCGTQFVFWAFQHVTNTHISNLTKPKACWSVERYINLASTVQITHTRFHLSP